MFSKRVYFVAVPLLLAAIAANVPRAWIHGQTAQERTSEVLSAFINLGSDPAESPIKADWLVRNERLKLLREERLVHIPPALIEVYAEAEDMTEAAFRTRLIDPVGDDPFETATAPLVLPTDAPEGVSNGLSWAVVRSRATGGFDRGCGLWLVFWDQQDWFYAPIGTETMNDRVMAAIPNLWDLPRAKLHCDAYE